MTENKWSRIKVVWICWFGTKFFSDQKNARKEENINKGLNIGKQGSILERYFSVNFKLANFLSSPIGYSKISTNHNANKLRSLR